MEPTQAEATAGIALPVHAYPRPLRAVLAVAQALACVNLLAAAAAVARAAAVAAVRPPPPALLAEVALATALPWGAAAFVRWRARGTATVEGGALRLALRDRRIEVPLSSLREARAWRLPAPRPGVALRMSAGRPFRLAIEAEDPGALLAAIARAGAPVGGGGLAGVWARARSRHGLRARESVARWVLVPLVLAAALFHAHQAIAFGGVLGEWRLVAPAAWLRSLAGHWAASLALVVLVAAAARGLGEAACAAATAIAPRRADGARQAAEWLCRVVLYAGLPALVAARFLA